LLGGLDLLSPAGDELALTTRKDRLLLAYLALNSGIALPRDRLAGLLWGDRGETQARDSLRQSLAAIRQAFRSAGPDPLITSRGSVTFDGTDIQTDATEFARLAQDADARDAAATLYRGELLEGLDGLTPEFDAWLVPERARLSSLAMRLLEKLPARPGHAGETLAQRLLARDPLCEPAYRMLMRMHAAAGERAAALKLYAACRNALKRDLGVAPDLATETLYRDILTDGAAAPAGPSAVADPSSTDPSSGTPTIAVLPFDNLSHDPGLAHLCDGIAEDITTGLGRFKLLFVIDRHSSATVAKQVQDVAEIGRRLGVAQVVQGSLQRHGDRMGADRLRITVRLVDATTRAQVWSEAFDCPLEEIVSMPERITGAIVSTLYDRVESALLDKSRRKPALAAYECVLRGIRHLRGYEPDDNRRAVELFQRAVDLEPDYALAIAYRGFADVVLYHYDESPPEILASARDRALAAVRLDPENSRCHWLLGMIVGFADDLRAEERHYQQALALNPNDANVLATYAVLLAALGRIDDSLDRMREAMRRNPYHPEWYWSDLAMIFYMARRYEDALEAYQRRASRGYWVLSRIAACYAQLGRMDEARAATAEILRLKPDFSIRELGRAGWTKVDFERVREGMRKAGLPE
jgi:DNA-binding SARP family transcriptional activator/TolB-like protein/Flp pilus assembly protein TadD